MVLLAKRVSAARCAANNASTSAMPEDRAARCTSSNARRHCCIVRTGAAIASSAIRSSDGDIVETRRAGAVARADHLFRLPLAAIRYAPQYPMIPIGDGRARVPEFRGDPAVGGILEH